MSDFEVYRLRIEAYTPETMPMERLAAYLGQLATLLGEPPAVHFSGLEAGSTSIVFRIEREAIPRIRHRTVSVRRGEGPRDVVRAYGRINAMLREDDGSAVWTEVSTAADILVFPGARDSQEPVTGIARRGSLDGEVIRVGGSRNVVPIMLRCEQRELSGCWAGKAIAKQLAHKLFEPVRLFGTGRWNRGDDGSWALDIFRVESFVPLRDASLSEALAEIRAIPAEWGNHSLDELSELRDGAEGAGDGGA